MAVRTRLHVATQGGSAALHDGVRGAADVGRHGMALRLGRKGVLEDRLERDESHWCLRTQGIGPSLGCFIQYHANHPRDKR